MDEEGLERVWREFGKQTQAGKLLYDLYGVRFRPDKFIKYPKVKVKTEDEKKREKEMNRAHSVNLLKKMEKVERIERIDYPNMNQKYSNFKINKIDLIPKRKKENVIKDELDDIKRNMANYKTSKPNQNRKMQIEQLQNKFQFQEGAVMPKAVRMPGVKTTNSNSESNSKLDYHQKIKYGQTSKKDELEYLYESVMKEIDERYLHMEEMKKLGKDVDLLMMGEIKSRLDELKNIQRMLSELK